MIGLAALIPPTAYVIGGWKQPGFGPPFMITYLYGPGSHHTTIGLVLLALAKIICPLVAIIAALGLLRRGHRHLQASLLLVAGLVLLLINLATRQPYA